MITLLSIHNFPLKPSSLQPLLVYCLAWHTREREIMLWHLKGWFLCCTQNSNKWRSCPANNGQSASEEKKASPVHLLSLQQSAVGLNPGSLIHTEKHFNINVKKNNKKNTFILNYWHAYICFCFPCRDWVGGSQLWAGRWSEPNTGCMCFIWSCRKTTDLLGMEWKDRELLLTQLLWTSVTDWSNHLCP